jgi:hypothetical protein
LFLNTPTLSITSSALIRSMSKSTTGDSAGDPRLLLPQLVVRGNTPLPFSRVEGEWLLLLLSLSFLRSGNLALLQVDSSWLLLLLPGPRCRRANTSCSIARSSLVSAAVHNAGGESGDRGREADRAGERTGDLLGDLPAAQFGLL